MSLELQALKWVERKYVGAMEMDGICGVLLVWYGEDSTVERDCAYTNIVNRMWEWPEHSGNDLYSVPGFDEDGNEIDPENAFCETARSDMWNENHPYGAARIRLLRWLISEFDKELKMEPASITAQGKAPARLDSEQLRRQFQLDRSGIGRTLAG